MSTMDEGKRSKRSRRSFTDEFKVGAVRLVLDEGKTVAQVARDLDLTESALRTWVERARADRTQGKTGLTTAERAELTRLRKENRELRMHREIYPQLLRQCRRRALVQDAQGRTGVALQQLRRRKGPTLRLHRGILQPAAQARGDAASSFGQRQDDDPRLPSMRGRGKRLVILPAWARGPRPTVF